MRGSWTVDRSVSIGSGGFGRVYAATDPAGNSIAAKVLRKAPGASRDLLMVEIPPSEHVLPLLHLEEDEHELTLFMPRATGSLRDRLDSESPVSAAEGLEILEQIARGLVALEGHVVHRDLKPENVLLWESRWAICDFGISRYAEASTAPDTQKYSMTPAYAAPEQWRYDHATAATDIYAFGVIAHEVLGGERPFPGPSHDDFREQHLSEAPPKLSTTKKLSSLVQECLFKAPGARPHPQNLLARLTSAGADAQQPGASALADAHQAIVDAAAATHQAQERARTEQERRKVLADAAEQLYDQIVAELEESISEGAPTAQVWHLGDGTVQIALGEGELVISPTHRSAPNSTPFDVIAYGSIKLSDGRSGMSRSHSLYYADFDHAETYEWFELGFCAGFGADFEHEPRSLPPHEGLSIFQRSVGSVQLGRPITALRLGELDLFVDQWAERLGLTAQGKFPRVYQLPEGNPQYPRR